MRRSRFTVGGFALLALLGNPACSGEDGALESIESQDQAVLNVDEFLYLRCSSNNWTLGASTRLQSTEDPYLFTLTYDVTRPDILSNQDECIFTKTNQLDGWGSSQTAYSSSAPRTPLMVPAGDRLTTSWTNFTVRYPAAGRYKLTVNWRQGSFHIASDAAPSCTDGVQNGTETDVDCGGSCSPCDLGQSCAIHADCQSGQCVAGQCVAASGDSDGDGLADEVETNTGVFVGPQDTGTDPFNRDTDGDRLSDGDETLGTAAGLDLPALGTSPLRKDILLEYDWFEDDLECAAHSHRPTPTVIAQVVEAFANAPVGNPDGSTGINLINDYGQGGVFTGGNHVEDADGVLEWGVSGPDYNEHRQANFAANRAGYFHYVLLPHRYNRTSWSSGQAEIVGDDLVVSLYCMQDEEIFANTIMHELGHNLGLLHGGNEGTNDKPNYNSVMNYRYQFPGASSNCEPYGNGLTDFSRNQRITLDESFLDERRGVCGDVAVDWNSNGAFESSVALDLNGDGWLGQLTDHDDWSALVYDWNPGGLVHRAAPAISDCEGPPRVSTP